jgi:hypothetical protein
VANSTGVSTTPYSVTLCAFAAPEAALSAANNTLAFFMFAVSS